MTEIISVTVPTCGSCRFSQKFEANGMADCFGNPPTVVPIGQTRDVLNRPALQLETFVPRIHKDRPACHLHQHKQDFVTAGNS